MKKLIILTLLISCSKPNVGKIESCPNLSFNDAKLKNTYNQCCSNNSGAACFELANLLGNKNFPVHSLYKRSCQFDLTVGNCAKAVDPAKSPQENLSAYKLTCQAKVVNEQNELEKIVACATHAYLTKDDETFKEHFKYLNKQYTSAQGKVKNLSREALLQVYLSLEDNDKALELLKGKFNQVSDSVNAIWKWSASSDYLIGKFKTTVEFRELLLYFQKAKKR